MSLRAPTGSHRDGVAVEGEQDGHELVGGVAGADVEHLAGDPLGHGVAQARVQQRGLGQPVPLELERALQESGGGHHVSASSPLGGLRGLECHGAGLELGHPGRRVEGGVREVVDRRLARPVERGEDGVGADLRRQPRAHPRHPAPGAQRHVAPVGDAEPRGQVGMDVDDRLGLGVEQRLGPPGLRAGLVVRPAAPGGEAVRVLVVGRFGGVAVVHDVEARPAVGGGEAVLEEARRASVIFRRARPEDAALVVDALVADARVVGRAARARATQLVEHRAGLAVEEGPAAQPVGDLGEDLEVAAHALGGLDGPASPQDTALEVGHRALLLGPLGAGQDDVGELGGLAEEQVARRTGSRVRRAVPARGRPAAPRPRCSTP